MKMTREEFKKNCNNDITLMANVSGLSYDECAESMYIIYCTYYVDEEREKEIIHKLSELSLETPVGVEELKKVIEKI